VLAYNPTKLSPSELPTSLLDVGGPNWHGKVGIAPSDADFQAIVAAVAAADGTAKAKTWLQNLKKVSQSYDGNSAILQAINRGDLAAGIIYHYYYFRDQAESGANSNHVKMYYFGVKNPGDPGAYISVSGAGVLKTSDHQKQAQQFLKFLTSVRGQTDLAKSDDFEYPLNPAVPANPKLTPLDQLGTPDIGPGTVGDGRNAVTLLQQVGLL
jgi:iron(III) transport system substrate-binding protein